MKISINDNKLIINKDQRLSIDKWTPDNIAYIWYDASDENVIELDTNGRVSKIIDKGIMGLDMFQLSESKRPYYGIKMVGDKKTITFNPAGENHTLRNSIDQHTVQDYVFAICMKPLSSGNEYYSAFSYSSTANDYQIDAGNGNFWYGNLRTSDYGAIHQFDNVDSYNKEMLIGYISDVENNILIGYKNAKEAFQINNFNGFNTTDVVWKLATNRNGTRFMHMDFYEMVVAPKKYAKKVHEYLIYKWRN